MSAPGAHRWMSRAVPVLLAAYWRAHQTQVGSGSAPRPRVLVLGMGLCVVPCRFRTDRAHACGRRQAGLSVLVAADGLRHLVVSLSTTA